MFSKIKKLLYMSWVIKSRLSELAQPISLVANNLMSWLQISVSLSDLIKDK